MKGIEFDIMFWDDSQTQLNNIGIRPSMLETGTRRVTFYVIDCIAQYIEDGKDFCTIYSGDSEYIVNDTYVNVKHILSRFDT